MKYAIDLLAVLGLVATIVGCGSSSSSQPGSAGASGAAHGSGASGGAGGTATNAQGAQAGARATGGTVSGTGTAGSSGGSGGGAAGTGGSGGNSGGPGGSSGSGSDYINPYAGPGTACYADMQCPLGQFCCEDVASDSGCIASAASCGCATPGSCIVLQCDEPSDCQTGLCCATRSQTGEPRSEFSSVLCKPSCGENDYQVCSKDSDCPLGHCGPSGRAGLFRCF